MIIWCMDAWLNDHPNSVIFEWYIYHLCVVFFIIPPLTAYLHKRNFMSVYLYVRIFQTTVHWYILCAVHRTETSLMQRLWYCASVGTSFTVPTSVHSYYLLLIIIKITIIIHIFLCATCYSFVCIFLHFFSLNI